MNAKSIFVTVLAFVPMCSSSAAELSVDVRCFSNPGGTIQLEFRTYTDAAIGWIGGQVRYKGSREYIPLVFESSKELTAVPGRPSEFEHRWLEFANGAINGEYRLLSQGANVYGFRHISRQGGRVTVLSKPVFADDDGRCPW